MLLAATGIGRALRGLWRSKDDVGLGAVPIDTSLGLGVMSLAIFALGALQLFHPRWIVLLVPTVGLILVPGAIRGYIKSRDRSEKRSRVGWPSLLLVLLGVLAVAALIPALAPPSMSDWDSLAYHLAVPKLYLQHGGIYYIDFTSHSNFPFLVEMLYVPGLAVGSVVAAKLMHYWIGVLLVLSVMQLARRHFSAGAAPLAGITVAGMPIVLWEATTAYVDLGTALYAVVCAYFLLECLYKADRRCIVGCAVAAGFAASTKMTALAVIALLVAWLLVDRLAVERRFEWKPALLLGGVAVLVCSPWYVKSLIYTGNPVYPFFYSIFGGRDWTAGLASNYWMLQARFGMGHGVGALLALPYNLTAYSYAFYDTPGLYVGPILLVSVPILLLLFQRRSSKLIGLLGFFLAQVVIWFFLSQQSRYLIPAFAVLAVLTAAIAYSDDRLRVVRGLLAAVFAGTAVFGLWTLFPAVQSAATALSCGRDVYLRNTLDIYPAQRWMNENLPETAKVALFGDTRGFYLHREYVWADPGHNAEFTRDLRSPEDLVRYLKSQGITHVMVNYRFFAGGKLSEAENTVVGRAVGEGLLEQVFPEDGGSCAAVYVIE